MSKLFKYTWIAWPHGKNSESCLYHPGKCSTEWGYASICVASSLLYTAIGMIKIISGMKEQIKNRGQDILETRALIAEQQLAKFTNCAIRKKQCRDFSISKLPGEISWAAAEEFVQTSGTSEQNWPQLYQWLQRATENYSFHPSTQLQVPLIPEECPRDFCPPNAKSKSHTCQLQRRNWTGPQLVVNTCLNPCEATTGNPLGRNQPTQGTPALLVGE